MRTAEMLGSHPEQTTVDADLLARAIDALAACALACTTCADACLAEGMVSELRRCIRTDLDCADVGTTTLRLLSRRTETDLTLVRAQLQACVIACRTCGEECETHADMHEHCRVCAEACGACEQVCTDLLAAMN